MKLIKSFILYIRLLMSKIEKFIFDNLSDINKLYKKVIKRFNNEIKQVHDLIKEWTISANVGTIKSADIYNYIKELVLITAIIQ